MRRVVTLALLVTAALLVKESHAYKALFIGAVGSKSHKNFYMGIISQLVENGHHVTLVTPFPSKGSKANIREVSVPQGDVTHEAVNRFDEPGMPSMSTLKSYYDSCTDTLSTDQVQDLLKEKFDVVFMSTFFTDCYLTMVYQLQVPLVLVCPMGLLSTYGEYVGNPSYPSFVAAPIFEMGHPLTFLQRTLNTLSETVGNLVINGAVAKLIEWDCRKRGFAPPDMPSFTEIRNNASLMFVNSIRELEFPARPYVHNIIHVGGIHCRPAEPLPKDLQEWIDGAGEHGFIFFSLGSAVTPSDIPEKQRQALIRVFGSLKQRVLWKWDKESMPDMPPNVRIGKWLPQQDILGHPKLRLFITHGGLLSTFESIHHGRPILGLPVFADQAFNMKEVDRQGWGKVIMWEDLTEEVLRDKINFVMTDEKMKQNVVLRSNLMRDQPVTPKQLVTYWTDYIIRYNGAKHLRCPIVDLPWYKVYNIDVWTMLVMVLALALWVLGRIIRAFIRCMRRKPKNKQD